MVTSTAEAEMAGLFFNCQTAIYLTHMLHALGHPQAATPVKIDNKSAAQFVSDTIKHKRSKAWNMIYHWLAEKQAEDTFNIFWDHGKKTWPTTTQNITVQLTIKM